MFSKKSLLIFFTAILATFGLIVFTGCEEDESTNGNGYDPAGAEALVEEANSAMDTLLFNLINNPPEEPAEADFTEPYNLYVQALEKDGSNLDANFGAGLCGMLMLSQDSEFQGVWDEWMDFLLEEDPPSGSSAGTLPELGFPYNGDNFNLPLGLVPGAVRSLASAADFEFPSIGRLQAMVRNSILTRLNYAVDRLRYVALYPDYEFIVTPMMQGDPNEDALEIDKTEVCAALVPLYLVRGFLNIMVAYDFDINPGDSADVLQSLEQSSGFLGLVSDGNTRLSTAKSSFLYAAEYLEEGINFLRNETDDQSNDVIKIDGDGLHEADLDSILEYLDDYRQALTGNYEFTADFDDDPGTPEQDLTVRLTAFFNGGIPNFKALLPTYTVEVEAESLWTWYDYHFEEVVEAEVNVADAGWYSYSY